MANPIHQLKLQMEQMQDQFKKQMAEVTAMIQKAPSAS